MEQEGHYDTMFYRSIEDDSQCEFGSKGNSLASYSFIQKRLRNILGKTLTVLDVAITDKQQNKATKDIIKDMFATQYSEICELMIDMRGLQESMGPNLSAQMNLMEVSQDEALGLK